jgi:hypothetical protein
MNGSNPAGEIDREIRQILEQEFSRSSCISRLMFFGQRKIPKGFNHSARRWPMKLGYAGIIGKTESTLKGLD